MSRTAPHFLARVALLLLLAPHLAGCYTTRAVAYNPNSLKDATGVTMRSGSTIMFEDGGASIFIAAGVNVKALSSYLGHSSITLTVDTYGAWARSAEKAQAERLAGVFAV